MNGFLRCWKSGHTSILIFIGQSLQDSDLRQLLSVDRQGASRPRYFIVAPNLSEHERRLWEGRRVTPLAAGTFRDFLESLDGMLLRRGIRASAATDEGLDHAVVARFTTKDPALSASTRQFLMHEATYIHAGMAIDAVSPTDFYRGKISAHGGR